MRRAYPQISEFFDRNLVINHVVEHVGVKHVAFRRCLAGHNLRPRAHRFAPQSSSASRFTAGAAGFLILSQ